MKPNVPNEEKATIWAKPAYDSSPITPSCTCIHLRSYVIQEVIERGQEWWYVDVGYITEQITRYPKPIINDYDKTYFRIVKGGMHISGGKPGDGSRHRKLIHLSLF